MPSGVSTSGTKQSIRAAVHPQCHHPITSLYPFHPELLSYEQNHIVLPWTLNLCNAQNEDIKQSESIKSCLRVWLGGRRPCVSVAGGIGHGTVRNANICHFETKALVCNTCGQAAAVPTMPPSAFSGRIPKRILHRKDTYSKECPGPKWAKMQLQLRTGFLWTSVMPSFSSVNNKIPLSSWKHSKHSCGT